MIKIEALAKSFAISRGQKLSDSEKQDVRYSKEAFHSVRNVSFECGSGEVLGLLGPNGAGKTTTLRILSTALQPDSGSVLIEGVDVLHGTEHTMLPDMIEIGSFIGMAVMTQSEITIKNCQIAELGIIPDVFKKLGIQMEFRGDDIHIQPST